MTTAESTTCPASIEFDGWRAIRATGELVGAEGTQRLEPKVADLLFLLATQPGQPFTREQIIEALWPDQIVGDDSLARAVFKLRQALGDDAKSPRYIETISRRGYRMMVQAVASSPADSAPDPILIAQAHLPRWRSRSVLLGVIILGLMATAAWWFTGQSTRPLPSARDSTEDLADQADDFYFQFSRGDNEAAIVLYERVLGLDPDDPHALAGLANALVQRSVRWPDLAGEPALQFTQLRDALANGHLDQAPASLQLERARQLAERAVALAPESAPAHKAVGFVASAQGRFEAALQSYAAAITIDPEAWGALINTGDVLEISGRSQQALPYFERAYAAMERGYARSPVQIRPWHAQLGTVIAGRHASQGDASTAEAWYRRVLQRSPLHPEATRGLTTLLRAGGDQAQAQRLCAELVSRVGEDACAEATR